MACKSRILMKTSSRQTQHKFSAWFPTFFLFWFLFSLENHFFADIYLAYWIEIEIPKRLHAPFGPRKASSSTIEKKEKDVVDNYKQASLSLFSLNQAKYKKEWGSQ